MANHWIARRGSFLVLLGALFSHQVSAEDRPAALEKGLNWLMEQQAEDGGWHSATYGQLKDGAGMTALALYAAGHAPLKIQEKYAEDIRRGYAFLSPGLVKQQTIASPDGSLDYPTYAAALWLAGRQRLRLEMPREERDLVVRYLRGAQVLEARGFAADSPSYGGWDFLGAGDARGITTGTNLSVTAYVLEALAGEGAEFAPMRSQATTWTLRCQQRDGGFAFTPEPMSLNNKADFGDEGRLQPRSYGTATCDGIRALIAAGKRADDPSIRKGVTWLVERQGVEIVPGFEALPQEVGWQRGLRFYYYASLAKCLPYFPQPEGQARAGAVGKQLVAAQSAAGFWQNESSRMREDDPLIATSLAVLALADLSQHFTGEPAGPNRSRKP